jgi:hypothetical protein
MNFDEQAADDYFRSQGLVLNAEGTEWVKPSTPIPDWVETPDSSPADVAAYRVARGVKHSNPLPVQDDRGSPFSGPADPARPSYIMEPDLQEAQGGMHLPPGLMQEDSGRFYYQDDPAKTVPVVQRPGLVPLANTPEGYKFVMPKLLDLVGNVTGNVAAPRVAAKAGEMVLGSGMVKTSWMKNSAEEFLNPMKNILQEAGYDAKVVGSVAEKGKSNHDLDVLLIPKHENHNSELLEKYLIKNGAKVSYTGDNQEIIQANLKNGKVVDFHFDNTLRSDTRNQVAAQVGHQIEKNGFYSQLERSVKDAKINLATPEQWLGYLRNQPGVKSEELQHVLGELPKDGMLSKRQLEDVVKANKVELKEKVLGSDNPQAAKEAKDLEAKAKKEFDDYAIPLAEKYGLNPEQNLSMYATMKKMDHNEVIQYDRLQHKWIEAKKAIEKPNTQYHQYQLPGGENYKEMLLSLPERGERQVMSFEQYSKDHRRADGSIDPNIEAALRPMYEGYKKDRSKVPSEENFKAPHFGDDGTNLLAHSRTNERIMPDEIRQAAQSELMDIKKQQHNIMSEIITTNEPLEKARQAKIQADLKAKRISVGDANRQMEKYVSHPEIKHLQDKLSELRAKEDAITKNLPPEIKGTHIEESQSDLHQNGREFGYKGEVEKLQPEFNKVEEKLLATNDDKLLGLPKVKDVLEKAVADGIITKAEAATYKRYTDIENHTAKAVPDFPFKKNWDELLFKKAIMDAVSKGHKFISVTPGEAQALRYQNEIRQKVNTIEWHDKTGGKPSPNGEKHILIDAASGELNLTVDKQGNIIDGHKELKDKTLSEAIGKDIARQILEKPEGNIDAKGYVMGAEGMKGYYDKMVIDKFNNIGKKYGAKMEPFGIEYPGSVPKDWQNSDVYAAFHKANKLPTPNMSFDKFVGWWNKFTAPQQERALKAAGIIPGGQKAHYFPITPALEKKANEGFELFSSSPTIIPVDHDPFEKDKKKVKLIPVSTPPVFK